MSVYDNVLGNLLTVAILGVLYQGYKIFASYLLVCLYALLLSEAMQRPKQILIRMTRGFLGSSVSTGLLMLATVGLLTFLVIVMMALSLNDVVKMLRSLQVNLKNSLTTESLQGLGLNASTIESLGVPQMIDSSMAYAQSQYTVLEAQYNETPWWPMVADAVQTVQGAQNSTSLTPADPGMLSHALGEKLMAVFDGANSLWTSITTMQGGTQELATMLLGVVRKRQQELMGALMYILQMGEVTISFLKLFTTSLVNLIFFFSLTLSLLSSEKSVVHELVHGLCGASGPRVERQLRQVSEGVFFFPVACYLGRYFYTLSVGVLLDLHFPFLLALLTLLLTLIPGLSPYPWIASVPWVLQLVIYGYLAAGFEFAKAVILFISQWQVLAFLEVTAAQRSFSTAPSWVTGLSVVCGFERFGLHAFFLAPLLVSLVILSFHLIVEAQEENAEELSRSQTLSEARQAEDKQQSPTEKSPASVSSEPVPISSFPSKAKALGSALNNRLLRHQSTNF